MQRVQGGSAADPQRTRARRAMSERTPTWRINVLAVALATSSFADAWQCPVPGNAQRVQGLADSCSFRMQQSPFHSSQQPQRPRTVPGGFYFLRSSVRRAEGLVKVANEDVRAPQQETEGEAESKPMSTASTLQALPLPLLPSPFNITLASLLGATPSKWRRATSAALPVDPPIFAAAGVGAATSSTGKKGRSRLQHTLTKNTQRISVESSEQLQTLLEQGVSVYKMDIRGVSLPGRQDSKGRLLSPTLSLPSPEQLGHPVIAALQERRRAKSKPGARKDGYKIALAIEGGGLRGCVSAGMASALAHLGLEDSFDMVLGSSAGSIIGAYFVGRSTPQTTYQFFCNHLTTSKEHLDGASWLDVSRLVDLFRPKSSVRGPPRAAMLLDYPMEDIMQRLCPLDWETFQKNDKVQPLKVIAAGLLSQGPVSLSSSQGSFSDLGELCNCIKASCMLPGVAGVNPLWLTGSSAPKLQQVYDGETQDEGRRAKGMEPMVDALVYEPIPVCTVAAFSLVHQSVRCYVVYYRSILRTIICCISDKLKRFHSTAPPLNRVLRTC